jgi:hypothetical protein
MTTARRSVGSEWAARRLCLVEAVLTWNGL